MCMLFGFSAAKPYNVDKVIKEFFKCSERHSDGWGIGYYRHGKPIVVKEPIKASESDYLNEMEPLIIDLGIAHIRKATKGGVSLSNTHPFIRSNWIFAHNGSIQDSAFKGSFKLRTNGDTDSEKALELLRVHLDGENDFKGQIERIEKYLRKVTRYGKVNLIFTDGQRLFVHTNMAGTLWRYKKDGLAMFSTEKIERVKEKDNWSPVGMNRLLVYENGELVYEGSPHENEYIIKPAENYFNRSWFHKKEMRGAYLWTRY